MLGIVLATFLSDVGHEMVTAILPLYLLSVGLGPTALGVIEGVADFAFSLSKLAGGVVGQRVVRKRPLAAAGYGVTAVCTAAIALASSAIAIGSLRVAAWIGRGFRGPLRDALLADEVEPTHFGRAYGVERAADMAGAVVGPLLALGMLWLGAPLASVIAVSFAPGILSAVSILLFTRDHEGGGGGAERPRQRAPIPKRYWLLVAGVSLFGLGDFSRTFLIFLVAGVLGGETAAADAGTGMLTGGALAYTAHNVISGLAAFPAGRWSDRFPKWQVLAGGYALGVVTNLLLAGAGGTAVGLGAAIVASGVYIAVQETVEKAAVAELLTREQRSLGFGILASANAIGDMVSSLYVGALLSAGRPQLAFGIAAGFGLLGTVWVIALGRAPR